MVTIVLYFSGLDGKYSSKFTPEVKALFDKIRGFKGKNPLPITERTLDFQEKLEKKSRNRY